MAAGHGGVQGSVQMITAVLASLLLTVAAPQPTAAAAKPKAKAAVPAKRKAAVVKARPVELFHVNSKEKLRLYFVDAKGRPTAPPRAALRRVDRFLRCHHTRKQARMNPRLTRLLHEIGRHWPGHRLEVVSGYRHPKVAKNPRSPHMKGLAVDFRVAGVTNTELRDYLRGAFPKVGVGYYPNSSFVHLDVRQGASAFWIDYSGPGENAFYSDNAGEDLKSGRAEAFKPTKIDPSWADRDDGDVGAPSAAPPPAAQSQSTAPVGGGPL
jgi:uncharacterized protein YcbK (DUF882 family)